MRSCRRSASRSAPTTRTSTAKPASPTSGTSSARSATASAIAPSCSCRCGSSTRIDRDFRPLGFDANAGRRPGQRIPARAGRLVRHDVRRHLRRRQVQHPVRVRPERRRPRHPRHRQAADRQHDVDKGTSTGKADFIADVIVSKEINQAFELSGYGGFCVPRLARPEDARHRRDLERPALGLRRRRADAQPAAPDRRALRREVLRRHAHRHRARRRRRLDALHVAEPQPGRVHARRHVDQPERPLRRRRRHGQLRARRPQQLRLAASRTRAATTWACQFRIGYHPGVRTYVPPPPPPPPPPPMTPTNRPPTVKARCEPCIVEVGKSSTVTCDANDPDGDQLTYRWTTPSGKLANPADRQTLWTAPMQEGSVPVTVHRGRRQERHGDRHGHDPGDQAAGEGVHVRRRALRLRPLLAAAGSGAHPRRGDPRDARRRLAPDRDRGPHLQHRHRRVQPRARRAPRHRGPRLPDVARHRPPTGSAP